MNHDQVMLVQSRDGMAKRVVRSVRHLYPSIHHPERFQIAIKAVLFHRRHPPHGLAPRAFSLEDCRRRCHRAQGVSGALPGGGDGASARPEMAAYADWIPEDLWRGSLRTTAQPSTRDWAKSSFAVVFGKKPRRACASARCLFLVRGVRLLAVSFSCVACALALIFALPACDRRRPRSPAPLPYARTASSWRQPIARNARNAPRPSRGAGRAANERSSATRQSRAASSVAAGAGRAGATAHACSGWRLRFPTPSSPVPTALLLLLLRRRKGLPLPCGECSPRVSQHPRCPLRSIVPQHTDSLCQSTAGTCCARTNSTTSSSPLTPSTPTSCPKVDRRTSTTSPSSGARSRSSHARSRTPTLRLTLPRVWTVW